MPDTLTIKDNRTGKQYDLDITNGTIRATDLRKVKVDENDVGNDFTVNAYIEDMLNPGIALYSDSQSITISI